MGRKISTFISRQTMNTNEFEVFHYKDARPEGIELHNHDFYEIYLFLQGEVDYQIENAIYPLERGDVLLVSPSELHRPIARESGSVYERIVLWVDRWHLRMLKQRHGLDFEQSFLSDKGQPSNLLKPSRKSMAMLMQQLDLMLTEQDSREYGSEVMRSSALIQVLTLVTRLAQRQGRTASAGGSDPLVDQVFDHINAHLKEDLSMNALSAGFFVDAGTLARRFKKQLGTTVPTYVRRKRLTLARNMLLEGQTPTVAALACGYTDYSSFYRAFRAEYGTNPREFVQALGTRELPA